MPEPPSTPPRKWYQRKSQTAEFTPGQRGRMVSRIEEGASKTEVAEEFKTSITTVTNTLKRHQQYNTRSSLPRSGRPKKLNPSQERLIFRHVLSHRHLNYTRICQDLKKYYNIEIGTALLRGMLMKRGMWRGRALTKMFLTPKNVRDRKDWLAKNKERNWDTVLFTDETSIDVGIHSTRFFTRRTSERYRPSFVQKVLNGPRYRVMYWAAVGKKYKSELIFAHSARHNEDGNMVAYKKSKSGFNNEAYSKIVRGPLRAAVTAMKELHGECVVVEDGAPVHKGPHVRTARRELSYANLTHPGNSPDLNLIAHVWRKLKACIKKRQSEILTVKDLMRVSQEKWAKLDQDYIDNLVDGMHERWLVLKAASGWYTPL